MTTQTTTHLENLYELVEELIRVNKDLNVLLGLTQTRVEKLERELHNEQ